MVLRPDDIEQSDFTTSRRGYDKDEVRAYLLKVAADVHELQEGADHEASSFLPLGDTSDLSGEDRFGALGDRIANLLRDAHEASEQTRESATNDANGMRSDAQQVLDDAMAEADRIREEAAAYRVQVDEEAVEIRNQAEIDGNARLDGRRAEIERQEAEVAAEQTAMAELADARAQVTTLLEEARAQSEFIKREAEEIIRAKVRANVDQAQRRIDIMRTTEQASKDRILTAQRELESALGRLDSEAVPEFPSNTEETVYFEAESRLVEVEGGEAPSSGGPQIIGDAPIGTADSPTGTDVIEADIIEADVVEEREDEATSEEGSEGAGSFGSAIENDPSAADPIAPPSIPVTDEQNPVAAPAAEEDSELVTATVPAGEAMPGDASATDSEDALARLVREAMQRAVDSARGSDS